MKIIDFKNSQAGTVRDVDIKNGVVTGYLATFGNVDRVGDTIHKGAFAKTLMERRNDIFFLNQHQFSQPHAKFAVLKEDENGLYFETNPFVKGVSYSDDTLKLYDAGVIDSQSIGYTTMQADHIGDVRHLKEIKLYEGSNVTVPADPQAKFGGFKNLTLEGCDKKINQILKFLRNGNVTDDTFLQLEIGLKNLQAHAFYLGKTQKEQPKPPQALDEKALLPLIEVIKNY